MLSIELHKNIIYCVVLKVVIQILSYMFKIEKSLEMKQLPVLALNDRY